MKKIAYLCSEYPAISHTFIFREIQSLREESIEVYTSSVRHPHGLQIMTDEEKQEAQATMVMKDISIGQVVTIPLKLLLKSPPGFVRMCVKALSFCVKGPKNIIKAVGYLGEAMILLDWLQKHDIHHVHEHFGNPTAMVAMVAKAYGGVSYSLSIHGPDIFYQVDSALLAEKVLGASFVRCISHYCRSQLWRITPHNVWDKFHIVRCGIDPELYKPETRENNEIPEILCVGRLCPAKGQHVLLEAAAILKEKKVSFHVTMVGDGEDRESLTELCNQLELTDFVDFTGALGQDEVRDYYRQADIFVLPSFAEGVPVVLMEAMAKEIPVISTRITGIPELIAHDNNGLLATPADIQELAGQLITLIESDEKRRDFGVKARMKVVDMYNQHKNNKELARLFLQYGD